MVETLYIDCSEIVPSAAMIEYICTGHDNSVPPIQPPLRPLLIPIGNGSDVELNAEARLRRPWGICSP